MEWEAKLLADSPEQWVVDQVIVFDWYDGPRRGWCALARPAIEFVFECVEEQPNPDGLDLRSFRIKELPAGSVAQALAVLRYLGPTDTPIWCPIWRFPSAESREQTESALQDIELHARATDLVVLSTDMERFIECKVVQVSLLGGECQAAKAIQ